MVRRLGILASLALLSAAQGMDAGPWSEQREQLLPGTDIERRGFRLSEHRVSTFHVRRRSSPVVKPRVTKRRKDGKGRKVKR